MSDSFVSDVVVVSDVVTFDSVVAWDRRRSGWCRRRWLFRGFDQVRNQIRLNSDSLLHCHFAMNFGKFDVVDVDDAAASAGRVTASSDRQQVAQRDLLLPLDAGGVLIRSGLTPSHQRSVVVHENTQVLMPTDFEEGQSGILNLVGPSTPNVVLRLHDDFQSVVQPFGCHVVGIEEHEAFRRIDETDLESDGQTVIAFGQVAGARQLVALHIGVLVTSGLEVGGLVPAEIDEARRAVERDVEIGGISLRWWIGFSFTEVDETLGDGLVDGASVDDVAVEERLPFGRVEFQVVDLHIGEVLILFREQRISADENVGRLSLKLILAVEGVGSWLSGDQLIVDVEVKTSRRMPRDLVKEPFADLVERRRQSPNLTGSGHDDVHNVLLVEEGETLRTLEVTAVGQESRFVDDVIHLHVEGDGETVRALIQVGDAFGSLIGVAEVDFGSDAAE